MELAFLPNNPWLAVDNAVGIFQGKASSNGDESH